MFRRLRYALAAAAVALGITAGAVGYATSAASLAGKPMHEIENDLAGLEIISGNDRVSVAPSLLATGDPEDPTGKGIPG